MDENSQKPESTNGNPIEIRLALVEWDYDETYAKNETIEVVFSGNDLAEATKVFDSLQVPAEKQMVHLGRCYVTLELMANGKWMKTIDLIKKGFYTEAIECFNRSLPIVRELIKNSKEI